MSILPGKLKYCIFYRMHYTNLVTIQSHAKLLSANARIQTETQFYMAKQLHEQNISCETAVLRMAF